MSLLTSAGPTASLGSNSTDPHAPPHPHVIEASYPIFISVIIIEVVYLLVFINKKKGSYTRSAKGTKNDGSLLSYYYNVSDVLSSVSAGTYSQLLATYAKSLSIVPYYYLYENYRIWDFGNLNWYYSGISFVLLLLAVDCGYYWFHRFSHEINFIWMGHVPHHSSEYMNFSTALRQGMFEKMFTWMFYLPLAVIGVPLPVYTFYNQVNIVFQFFVHTELLDKLHPIIEFIFNTPSHHRVHHARNPQYLDKNYAGMFVLWDRLFGTYADEVEQPLYGLVHGLAVDTPMWVQLDHVMYVIKLFWNTPGFLNKMNVIFFKQAGWYVGQDGKVRTDPIPSVDLKKPRSNQRLPSFLTIYLVVQSLFTTLGAIVYMEKTTQFTLYENVALTFYVMFSLQVYGMAFNKHNSTHLLEAARIALAVLVATYTFTPFSPVFYIALSYAALSYIAFSKGRVAMLAQKVNRKKAE